jgi:23S rRNA pseudouridine1911/1915/1917 synthase
VLEHQTRPREAGSRLDVLVASLYPQFTRSALELLFDKDMVAVNGHAAKAAYKVRPEDNIKIDETYLNNVPPKIDLPIIYEDKDVIVINKPAGLLTHSKGALNLEPTVASFIKNKLADTFLTGNRAGIVHRLDRGTTGVIITARSTGSLKWLQKQFSSRKVKKAYLAVAHGTLSPSEAVIDAPIGRNPKRPQSFRVMSGGKAAQTHYKVIREFKKNGNNFSEVELRPMTGRTHQLRIHLAYTGHPIVGDGLYGNNGQPVLLHAKSLELTLPSRQRKVFEAPLPPKFKDFTKDA